MINPIKKSDYGKVPVFWKLDDKYYLNQRWLHHFVKTLGIPSEIFMEWCVEFSEKRGIKRENLVLANNENI